MKNSLELESRLQQYIYIAGVDEAGRGPWAGPVCAAAVILPRDYQNELIDDSKKIKPTQRSDLAEMIKQVAISYTIVFESVAIIDQKNILQATKQAMLKALINLNPHPDYILIDAVKLDNLPVSSEAIIKGDQISLNIAAASILAKVARDSYMMKLHEQYPRYRFDLHKGYGTKLHQQMLAKYGPIKGVHRFSYQPIKFLIHG